MNQKNEDARFLEVVHDSSLYKKTIELREQVLRIPLGLSFVGAELEAEADSRHFALVESAVQSASQQTDDRQARQSSEVESETPIAVVVIKPTNIKGQVKLRQMAVDPSHQRKGLGKRLIRCVEAALQESGVERIELNARLEAIDFYLQLDYTKEGPEFIEVGITHQKMVKLIQQAGALPSI